MERTLCIFKPDLAADRVKVGNALVYLLQFGFMPVELVRDRITCEGASSLYYEHAGRDYYEPNIAFITSGDVYLMVLEGPEGACKLLREVVGPTDPFRAPAWTLRGRYGTGLPQNAVHASADVEAAKREISIFFGLGVL